MIKKCEWCGVEFEVKDNAHGRKRRFCSTSCSAYWRNKEFGQADKSEEALARLSQSMKQRWKEGSFRENNYKRMTENNPMKSKEAVDKMLETRAGTYDNKFNNCGNGKISDVEKIAYDILIPIGFEYNKSFSTKTYRDLYPERNYPTNYKPDFYKDGIIIEIDGTNHKGKQKLVDRKKDEFFELLGIKVIRYTNDFVKEHTDEFEKEVKNLWELN